MGSGESNKGNESGKGCWTLGSISAEMIVASEEIRIGVMVELCQGVLDGRGMPDDWVLSVVVPIFKGKRDAMNCMAYRGVKLLEHAMKIVGKVAGEEIAAYGES